MSDRIAFTLLGLIFVAILADQMLNSGAALFFLVRKLADFVEYLAFWR